RGHGEALERLVGADEGEGGPAVRGHRERPAGGPRAGSAGLVYDGRDTRAAQRQGGHRPRHAAADDDRGPGPLVRRARHVALRSRCASRPRYGGAGARRIGPESRRGVDRGCSARAGGGLRRVRPGTPPSLYIEPHSREKGDASWEWKTGSTTPGTGRARRPATPRTGPATCSTRTRRTGRTTSRAASWTTPRRRPGTPSRRCGTGRANRPDAHGAKGR